MEEIRPDKLADYAGQETVRESLELYISAALKRKASLDHVLLTGPPGLGKTTLAHIIANEMMAPLHTAFAPTIKDRSDVAKLLTNLAEGDVLFIDEIHRLSPLVEETLYAAMEDYKLDLLTKDGRTFMTELPRFTLIGATTRPGLVSQPLQNRFGIIGQLDFYSPETLNDICWRSSQVLGIEILPAGSKEIAKRSRGTPRITNRLLRRVGDYASVKHQGQAITCEIANAALEFIGVDSLGLDKNDRALLITIIEKFSGGPVGVMTLATALNEEKDNIEEVIEPYLMRLGFLDRTPRGRTITKAACDHLGQGKFWQQKQLRGIL